jgi:hypothetical protein
MVRRAHDHRIDLVVDLVEHLAEVLVPLGARELLEGFGRVEVIDVAQRDEILARDAPDIVAPASGDANPGDIELLIRRKGPDGAWIGQDDEAGASQGRVAEKRTAGHGSGHRTPLLSDRSMPAAPLRVGGCTNAVILSALSLPVNLPSKGGAAGIRR